MAVQQRATTLKRAKRRSTEREKESEDMFAGCRATGLMYHEGRNYTVHVPSFTH